MFVRENFERELGRLFDIHKMGATVWSPLCGGILSGKYNEGGIPPGARWSNFSEHFFLKMVWNKFFAEDKKEKLLLILNGLSDVAKELGVS